MARTHLMMSASSRSPPMTRRSLLWKLPAGPGIPKGRVGHVIWKHSVCTCRSTEIRRSHDLSVSEFPYSDAPSRRDKIVFTCAEDLDRIGCSAGTGGLARAGRHDEAVWRILCGVHS